MRIFIDPGHGMSNRKLGIYDSGNVWRAGTNSKPLEEADIAMDWANELRAILQGMGHHVIRSRKDRLDPAPLNERVKVAREYQADVFISIHCNGYDGKANGTETFYRGAANKALAQRCNDAVVEGLGTKSRGLKLESASQHSSLAVLNFPRACLIELGFMDHAGDRSVMLDQQIMLLACQNLATAITQP